MDYENGYLLNYVSFRKPKEFEEYIKAKEREIEFLQLVCSERTYKQISSKS